MNNSNSELRQDLTSGEWVIISPNRNKRPTDFFKKKIAKRIIPPEKDCPFEDPENHGNLPSVLSFSDKTGWRLKVFPNKFPALKTGHLPHFSNSGPYLTLPAIGHHELIITKDHLKNFPGLSLEEAATVFYAAQNRFQFFKKDKFASYAVFFQNWGKSAGASIFHPHYQLASLPIIPPYITHSVSGAKKFYKKNKQCAYCATIEWEKKEGKRVILENEQAVAFTRFASKEPFDVRIFPKNHEPFFEKTSPEIITGVVEVLQKVLLKIKRNLYDADYNFFIHSSPLKNQKSCAPFYHWHIDIIPKISISAGMELATGVEITVIDPDDAAAILRR